MSSQNSLKKIWHTTGVTLFSFLSLIFILASLSPLSSNQTAYANNDYSDYLKCSSSTLTFGEMNLHYRDIHDMVDEVCNMNSSDAPSKRAWTYVIENTNGGNWCLTDGNWQHHPEVLINSVRFGYCDDRASVLAALWKAMGYEVRIWSLEGHVVPEVNDETGWKVFDPDCYCFFTDENNKVASYHDLITNASLYMNSYQPQNYIKYLFEGDNLNLPSKDAYEKWMRAYYTTEQNNSDVTQWHFMYTKNISNKVVMPQLSNLDFMQLDNFHFEGPLPVKNFIKITLLPGAMGVLYLPLVPIKCEGRFRMIYSGKDLLISETSGFNYDHSPIDSFFITEVMDTSRFYFLANGITADGTMNNSAGDSYDDLKTKL